MLKYNEDDALFFFSLSLHCCDCGWKLPNGMGGVNGDTAFATACEKRGKGKDAAVAQELLRAALQPKCDRNGADGDTLVRPVPLAIVLITKAKN